MPDIILAKKDDITKLNADVNTEGSILKSIKDNAKNATYDNSTSGLTADTLGDAIDEVEGRVDDIEDRVTALDTITYDGITYVITRAVVDDHIVETYTEVE